MTKAERMDPAESAEARGDPDTITVNSPVGEVGPDPREGTGSTKWFRWTFRTDPVTGHETVTVGPRRDMFDRHEMGSRIPIPKRPFNKASGPRTESQGRIFADQPKQAKRTTEES